MERITVYYFFSLCFFLNHKTVDFNSYETREKIIWRKRHCQMSEEKLMNYPSLESVGNGK